MQEFTTHGKRHDFTIDGQHYWLPGVTIGDFELVVQFDKMPAEQMVPAFRDFIVARMRPDGLRRLWLTVIGRSPARAARALSANQMTNLYRAWAAPGEASSSSDSQ